MSPLVSTFLVRLAEGGEEHEVSHLLSWGIGLLAFGILFALLFGLLAFGKGREHS